MESPKLAIVMEDEMGERAEEMTEVAAEVEESEETAPPPGVTQSVLPLERQRAELPIATIAKRPRTTLLAELAKPPKFKTPVAPKARKTIRMTAGRKFLLPDPGCGEMETGLGGGEGGEKAGSGEGGKNSVVRDGRGETMGTRAAPGQKSGATVVLGPSHSGQQRNQQVTGEAADSGTGASSRDEPPIPGQVFARSTMLDWTLYSAISAGGKLSFPGMETSSWESSEKCHADGTSQAKLQSIHSDVETVVEGRPGKAEGLATLTVMVKVNEIAGMLVDGHLFELAVWTVLSYEKVDGEGAELTCNREEMKAKRHLMTRAIWTRLMWILDVQGQDTLPQRAGVMEGAPAVSRESVAKFCSAHQISLCAPSSNVVVDQAELEADRKVGRIAATVKRGDIPLARLSYPLNIFAVPTTIDKAIPGVFCGVIDIGQLNEVERLKYAVKDAGTKTTPKFSGNTKIHLSLAELETLRLHWPYISTIAHEMKKSPSDAKEATFSITKTLNVTVRAFDGALLPTFELYRLVDSLIGEKKKNSFESLTLRAKEIKLLIQDFLSILILGMSAKISHRSLFGREDQPPDMLVIQQACIQPFADFIAPKIFLEMPFLVDNPERELIHQQTMSYIRRMDIESAKTLLM